VGVKKVEGNNGGGGGGGRWVKKVRKPLRKRNVTRSKTRENFFRFVIKVGLKLNPKLQEKKK